MDNKPVTLDTPDAYFEMLDRSSREHWWGRSIERIERRWLHYSLRKHKAYIQKSLRWLDVGCGTGARLAEWSSWGCWSEMVGIEPELKSSKTIKMRDKRLIQLMPGVLPEVSFEQDRFNFISSLDVIQHLPAVDRAIAIRNLAKTLAHGGLMLIRTNGAGLQFREKPDASLINAHLLNIHLMQSGLRVLKASHFNMIGGIVEDCISIFRRKEHHPDSPKKHGLPSAWQNRPKGSRAGSIVGWAESQIVASGLANLPLGHSYIVLAKKDLPHG